MFSSYEFYVDDCSDKSSTYVMIIGQDLFGESGIIMNVNDQTVTWENYIIPMKDRDPCTLSSSEAFIEVLT
jgi:hypothetical protein